MNKGISNLYICNQTFTKTGRSHWQSLIVFINDFPKKFEFKVEDGDISGSSSTSLTMGHRKLSVATDFGNTYW